MVRFHVGDCLADPVGGVVDDDGDVGEGGLRAGDHEEVGESGDGDAVAGFHFGVQLVDEEVIGGIAEVDFREGARDGVEADGEDDHVEFVGGSFGADSRWGDFFDGVGVDVDEGDVVAVEGFVVEVAEWGAFGEEGVLRGEEFGGFGVFDDGADLVADEGAGGVVAGFVGEHVAEGLEDEAEAAGFPAEFEDALEFRFVHVGHFACCVNPVHAEGFLPRTFEDLLVVALDFCLLVFRQGMVT